MPHSLYIVFSAPPSGVSRVDYNHWYEQHAEENVQTPGFQSVSRYCVEPVVVGRRTSPGEFELEAEGLPYNYAAVYEYDGEIGAVRQDLLDRVARGDIYQPEWFDRVSWMTWAFTPIGQRMVPRR